MNRPAANVCSHSARQIPYRPESADTQRKQLDELVDLARTQRRLQLRDVRQWELSPAPLTDCRRLCISRAEDTSAKA